VATPAHRRATYEDLLQVPDDRIAEIVDGDLHVSPRPTMRHSLTISALWGEIGSPFQQGRGGPGGWWILFEPELHLGEDVLVPDLGGWRRERMPDVPDAVAAELAPDWVCEVLSPSTERLDRARKMHAYGRKGVDHLWLINPRARTLEAYQRKDHAWLLLATHDGTTRVRVAPFDAVELDLAQLWGEPSAPE
jgi:Uma2 family endonuclease